VAEAQADRGAPTENASDTRRLYEACFSPDAYAQALVAAVLPLGGAP
jgi:hypothetical protein